jgi:hypothetical protein
MQGHGSAIAATLVYDNSDIPLGGAHMDTFVQVCGSDKAQTCAKTLLSEIDAEILSLQKANLRLWQALRGK